MIIVQLDSEQLNSLIQNAVRKVISENPKAEQPTEADELLTVQQAAELLNLSVPTLYGYTQRAEIPVCKRGKRLYFSKQSLFEWIKDGRKKTSAEIAAEAEQYLKTKKG